MHHKVLLQSMRKTYIDVLDVDVEDRGVFGIISHGALGLQHDVLCAFG